jgi:hypothetical protein
MGKIIKLNKKATLFEKLVMLLKRKLPIPTYQRLRRWYWKIKLMKDLDK